MELNFCETLKTLRKEHGITQEQLAEALGVTTGAVYKWENALAMPEIRMLIEVAEFFEVSVDFLLNYTVKKDGAEETLQRIVTLCKERKLLESAKEAEKALKKYPNHFKILYESAQTYYLLSSTDTTAAYRCIELLEQTCLLFDQNPYKELTLLELQEKIAVCHVGLKQYEKSIELLKKLNVNGSQSAMIGMLLVQFCHKPEEALSYLSDGFDNSLSSILRTTLGFTKAYIMLEKYDKAFDIIKWTYNLAQGLRDTSVVTFLDKSDAIMLSMLADVSARRGNENEAFSYLKQALNAAHRFDSAPEYRSFVGMKFYHGSKHSVSIDDFGETAYHAIENYLKENGCNTIQQLWREITDENCRR